MTPEELEKRKLEARYDPSPWVWWWLSFADPTRPQGEQFLGVAVVEGANCYQAAMRAHKLGCNPGGQVIGIPLLGGEDDMPSEFRNRLLSAEEISPWI